MTVFHEFVMATNYTIQLMKYAITLFSPHPCLSQKIWIASMILNWLVWTPLCKVTDSQRSFGQTHKSSEAEFFLLKEVVARVLCALLSNS